MELNNDHHSDMEMTHSASGTSSRSSTPSMTNCDRLQITNAEIRKFSILQSNVTHVIESAAPFAQEDDQDIADLYTRQAYLEQRRLQVGTNTPKNTYSTAVDNLIRHNTSYAQAASNKLTFNSKPPQQMATHTSTRRNPAISLQKPANQIVLPSPIVNNSNVEDNSPQALILQTLQQTIQALTVIKQQFSALSTHLIVQPSNLKNLKLSLPNLNCKPYLDNDD
ncbi:hypothetical protein TNIN_70381 [Trichonephila inaurata madagascariensis]|uniref:Uncharacterized protein n=1 Tax=Trichonephila inaurata madagascariensis TaxID=2747483 RepID=A0A8X6X7A5_9ARAC|nr:hypothetical protein TNIN_70381 [Trichonephila inaurata madagascariensis]